MPSREKVFYLFLKHILVNVTQRQRDDASASYLSTTGNGALLRFFARQKKQYFICHKARKKFQATAIFERKLHQQSPPFYPETVIIQLM